MDRVVVRKESYFDSVFLMSISAELRRGADLQNGEVVLATPANVQLLCSQGFDLTPHGALGPTDLVVALRAETADALDQAEAKLADLLKRRPSSSQGSEAQKPTGLSGAVREMPEANLAVISVPGDYAAYEARKALDAGLHVMIFSDNVSVEDEIALKQHAVRQGKLLMGPDCGTAIINGVMLGFANKVRRGPIGVIGASGTGTQEVTCLIERAGQGISQAIGTGGRDLSEKVGALTTLFAIDALDADPQTKVLVVISKPPAKSIADKVLDRLARSSKPSVVHFVGAQGCERRGNIILTPDLESTARVACELAASKDPTLQTEADLPVSLVRSECDQKAPGQKLLRGLFTGGTMGAEALAYLRRHVQVVSNLDHGTHVDPNSDGHVVVDLGDDEYTRGRPHPMIDPSPRVEWVMAEADNPAVSVILMDVVLGTGSHDDPAGAMLSAIAHAREKAVARKGHLTVVASVTGTAGDRQGLASQMSKLQQAGVVVLPSNIQAVRFALAVVQEARHG